MKRGITLALVVLLAAGCAQSKEQMAREQADNDKELAAALKDRVPGKPQDCISSTRVDGPQIIGNSVILYRETGRRVWRTDVVCPAMRPLDTLIVELHGSDLCRNDRFRVLASGDSIPSAYCMMGQFTPYTKE